MIQGLGNGIYIFFKKILNWGITYTAAVQVDQSTLYYAYVLHKTQIIGKVPDLSEYERLHIVSLLSIFFDLIISVEDSLPPAHKEHTSHQENHLGKFDGAGRSESPKSSENH